MVQLFFRHCTLCVTWIAWGNAAMAACTPAKLWGLWSGARDSRPANVSKLSGVREQLPGKTVPPCTILCPTATILPLEGRGTVAFMRDVVQDYLTRDCSVLPTNQSKELALSRGKTANVTTGFLQTSRLSTFETKIITSGSPLSTMDRSPMAHIGDRQYHFPIASTFSTFLCLLWDFGRNSGPSGHKLCIKIKTLI